MSPGAAEIARLSVCTGKDGHTQLFAKPSQLLRGLYNPVSLQEVRSAAGREHRALASCEFIVQAVQILSTPGPDSLV